MPLVWQTGVVVPLYKKGDRRVCSNYRGITLLSLPGKVYARVLERRIRPIVEPQIQEEQCSFRTGRGTLDQLYTLSGVLESAWVLSEDLKKIIIALHIDGLGYKEIVKTLKLSCSMWPRPYSGLTGQVPLRTGLTMVDQRS